MPPVCENCVLLVDADASMRDLLSRHLERAGYESSHAEDGIDALAKLRDTLPKVIISDLEMPRMSGYEFIAVVRRRFPSIPVIAVSGPIDGGRLAEIKPDRWLEKNSRLFPELIRAVNDLARTIPDQIQIRDVVGIRIRTPAGPAGDITLTCTECLRQFASTYMPGNSKGEGAVVCVHC